MILIGYHGTSDKIEFFDMTHLGSNQGQSVAPGIYFTKNRQDAIDYAKLSSERTGKPPRVYAVEVEVNHPVKTQDGKLFPSWPLFNSFLKEYFPSWFGPDGSLLSYKRDYVNEKYSTYRGQYSLIQYAAKENDLEVIEVFKSLGYDSILDGSTQFVILDPDQILSFEEVFGPETEIADESFDEDLDYWVQGQYDYYNAFGPESRKEISQNLKVRTEPVYRIEAIGSWNKSLFIGQTISLRPPRSFAKSLSGLQSNINSFFEFSDEEAILIKLIGKIKGFDVQEKLDRSHPYYNQEEFLVGGQIKLIKEESITLCSRDFKLFTAIQVNSSKSSYETIVDKYIVDSKRGENYRTMPGNRFKRRLRIRQNGGNRVWYDIDVNRFFRKDEFTFHIPVIGETDDYIEELQLQNWLPLLKYDIKHDGFSVQTFKRSLAKAMRTLDVKCNCTCKDFQFRHAYWFTIKGDNSGRPETRPADITNPHDTKGRGCKHLNYVMSLKTWCERIARILFNYCLNLYKQNKSLFMISVAKKLDLTEDMIENRPIRPRYAKPKEVQQEPQTQTPEKGDETEENPEEPAGESYYSSYYREATEYDEDQEYMIQIAKDQGVDVEEYVTPKNSPEQIFEVTRCIQSKLPEQIIIKLTNPDLSIQEIQVLREAYLSKIDLFPFIGFDADVLRQMLLASKSGIDPRLLAIKGMNHRQIECLRVALGLSKDLYKHMLVSKLNYEQMRQAIKDYRRK